MLRRSILLLVVLAALMVSATPALAHQYPITLYVDTAYTGPEYGTELEPYNSLEEAVAEAQAQPYGAYIWIKQTDGTWWYYGYIATVNPPITGLALTGPALIALLAAVCLLLVLGGWFLLRRSRAQRIPAY